VEGDGAYLKPLGGLQPHAGTVYLFSGCASSSGGTPQAHPVYNVSLTGLYGSVVDDDDLEAVALPVLAVSLDHDWMAPAPAVDHLVEKMPHAAVEPDVLGKERGELPVPPLPERELLVPELRHEDVHRSGGLQPAGDVLGDLHDVGRPEDVKHARVHAKSSPPM